MKLKVAKKSVWVKVKFKTVLSAVIPCSHEPELALISSQWGHSYAGTGDPIFSAGASRHQLQIDKVPYFPLASQLLLAELQESQCLCIQAAQCNKQVSWSSRCRWGSKGASQALLTTLEVTKCRQRASAAVPYLLNDGHLICQSCFCLKMHNSTTVVVVVLLLRGLILQHNSLYNGIDDLPPPPWLMALVPKVN